MPRKAGRWCGKCNQVHQGPCPKRVAFNRRRDDAHGGSGRGGRPWRRMRDQVFKAQHYLCQECRRQGKLVTVLVDAPLDHPRKAICDHIIPLAQRGLTVEQIIEQDADPLDHLQTLCRTCSDAKTREEALEGRGP